MVIGVVNDQSRKERGLAMPLTKKGKKIKSAMSKTYGKEKGEQVFYASKNAKKIKGVDKNRKQPK